MHWTRDIPEEARVSRLEFLLHASGAQHHGSTGGPASFPREDLPVVKAAVADRAAEAFVMPLTAERPDVLPNDGLLAPTALGRPSLGPLRLAGDTPCVAILLDVRHAALKRIAALGTEEVPEMPVSTEGDDVLAHDGRRTVLAARRKELVPVQMAIEP